MIVSQWTVTTPVVVIERATNGWPGAARVRFSLRDDATDRIVLTVRARATDAVTGDYAEAEGDAAPPQFYAGPTVSWSVRYSYVPVAEAEALAALAEARQTWAEGHVSKALAAMSVPSMDGTLTLFDPEAVLAAAERAAQATPLQRLYLSDALYGAPRA